MKSFNMLKLAVLGFCMVAAIQPAFAQITIEWDEIPHTLNTRWTKNSAYEVSVDLGSAGGPQTWSFTSQAMGTDSSQNRVIAVNQAPYHDSFPGANLVYQGVAEEDTTFLFMQLETNFLSTLGLTSGYSMNMVIKYDPADTVPLPVHYNDSRHYYYAYTYVMDSTMYIELEQKGYEHIDAYGTVTIPYGSFPCLRAMLWDTCTQIIYHNNVPILYDTTTRISHQFVAEDRGAVVCVFSMAEETNPYFTGAEILERLTYFATGVEETEGNIAKDNIVRVQPNPFGRTVTFAYTGETFEPVDVKIYDVQGVFIKTVVVPIGKNTTAAWNGTNEQGMRMPAGVYLYRAQADGLEVSGKVVKTY